MKKTACLFPENHKGRVWASIKCLTFSSVPIGKGALSTVYKATDLLTHKQFAVKRIDLNLLSLADQENVRRELDAYTHLSHHYIIRFYDFIIEKNVMYIILELAKGTLYSLIRNSKPLPLNEIKRIFSECLEVFGFIHSRGFLVRDIKPENILLDSEGHIRVCDFGWSCRLQGWTSRNGKSGTYPYMSPESLKGLLQHTPSDIWSLGILLYELHFQKEPFPGRSEEEMLRLIKNNRINFNVPGCPITENAIDLIRWMLSQNPLTRPTIRQILEHAFVDEKHSNTSSQDTTDLDFHLKPTVFDPPTPPLTKYQSTPVPPFNSPPSPAQNAPFARPTLNTSACDVPYPIKSERKFEPSVERYDADKSRYRHGDFKSREKTAPENRIVVVRGGSAELMRMGAPIAPVRGVPQTNDAYRFCMGQQGRPPVNVFMPAKSIFNLF